MGSCYDDVMVLVDAIADDVVVLTFRVHFIKGSSCTNKPMVIQVVEGMGVIINVVVVEEVTQIVQNLYPVVPIEITDVERYQIIYHVLTDEVHNVYVRKEVTIIGD